MRKVIVDEFMSLDGVAGAERIYGPGWDDALDTELAAVIANQGAVILGRRTYNGWRRSGRAARSNHSQASSTGYRSTSRCRRPLTRTGPTRWRSTATWSNSFGISSTSPAATSQSTEASRSPQAPLAAGVVDELILAIRPMIAAGRRRLLDGLAPSQLEMIRSEISPTGYMLVDYRVIH